MKEFGTPDPKQDAFGQEIMAYYKRECCVFEVIERDDGYVDVADPKAYFSEHDHWLWLEKEAMKAVKGRVLDVGCGPGRHSLYLQNKGFDVLGIDISPKAVEVAKMRGLKKAEVMSVEQMSFKPKTFDTVLMMGNNFGLLGSFKKARTLLRRFHTMTSEHALIIADTRDPYQTNNPDHLEYHRLNRARGRMSGQVRIRVRFRKFVSKWFDYLIVSKEEITQILDGTGWRIQRFIDSGTSVYAVLIEKVL